MIDLALRLFCLAQCERGGPSPISCQDARTFSEKVRKLLKIAA
jgi:hypothetical protein